MNYFELLGLTKEPFSNSPDPVFFFKSKNHAKCLHRLEIAIRLRRGLNVCLGQIGSGKSTLCRSLIQKLARDSSIVPHLILDPLFSTAREFLATLHSRFLGKAPAPKVTYREMIEALQIYLFREALENEKTILLIIDEGQKMVPPCLEVIRELLNYETNDAKLLQVIIFAQEEFDEILTSVPNFQDRINEFCRLMPLGFWDTRAMIRHRLSLAGTTRSLFTWPAYWAMYRASRGHPRKIMHLGHKVLLTLIVNNKAKASRDVILACARPLGWEQDRHPGLLLLMAAGLFLLLLLLPGRLSHPPETDVAPRQAVPPEAASEYRHAVVHEYHPEQDIAPGQGQDGEANRNESQQPDEAAVPHPDGLTAFPSDKPSPRSIEVPEALEEKSELSFETPPSLAAMNDADHRPPAEDPRPRQADTPTALATGPVQRFSTDQERLFPGSLFYLQVGGFLNRKYAEQTLAAMRNRHPGAGIIRVFYKGQQWDIVYLDHFSDPDSAIRKAMLIRQDEGLETAVVEAADQSYRFVWHVQ